MKNITLTRNGQAAPRDEEVSTMHADGLQVGDSVMLRIKGDCCYGKATPYKEYVVAEIKPTDRFDGKSSDVKFVRADKRAKGAVEVVPVKSQDAQVAEIVPTLEDENLVAKALSWQWRVAQKIQAHAVVAALRFGAMLATAEEELSSGRGRGRKGEGFKGWLEKNCPEINYKTAMRWRKLALAAGSMMKLQPDRLNLALDDKWWAKYGEGQSKMVVKCREKLFAAESIRALAALVFDYRSENLMGRPEGSQNEVVNDARRAYESWGLWVSDLSDSWALKSIPLLPLDKARAALNAMTPLVSALKRRIDTES